MPPAQLAALVALAAAAAVAALAAAALAPPAAAAALALAAVRGRIIRYKLRYVCSTPSRLPLQRARL